MNQPAKPFFSYADQVAQLRSRGMDVGSSASAEATLRMVNYYRLSGYWYPFRQLSADGFSRTDQFYPGTKLADVVHLHAFDASLRTATFSALVHIEIAMRALVGHELGRVDPCAHLDAAVLSAAARSGSPKTKHAIWLDKHEKAIERSDDDFVKHHIANRAGKLPVWAAVEVLDWGALTYLFEFCPPTAQYDIAKQCGLSAPQLRSWLKVLNVVRNTCAHHGRLFNRVHALKPKLPTATAQPELLAATSDWNRTFGVLTLIQFLLKQLNIGRPQLLPAVLNSYPMVASLPITHTGAPKNWAAHSVLWQLPL